MSTKEISPNDHTIPLPEQPSGTIAEARGPKRHTLLLVYHRDGVQAVPLLPGSGIVVGREPPADLAIPDQSLSRRHARFTLVSAEEVAVEDLDSTNGTRVAGDRVQRAIMRPGDEVLLGGIIASVIVATGAEASLLGLEGHGAFQRAVEIEIRRARFFQRGFAVMVVKAAARHDGRLSTWCPRVRRLLRPVDRAALYGRDMMEILLLETTPERALELGRAITARREGEPPLVCGIALFPGAAMAAKEIVDLSREAARRATVDAPVIVESEAHPTESGEGGAPQPEVVAKSLKMRSALGKVDRVADSTLTVLLQGETGTGKEVIANRIHARSARRDKPLICVNCGAIPESLLESTLFGHEKGAFTGADRQHKGLFEAADGGTIFLDEIGELTKAAQTSLLRVLETRDIMRVGATHPLKVDVRVIAATHRDLDAMRTSGAFREDLYHRLNVMALLLPPLRARREDIGPLALLFLKRAGEANDRPVRSISQSALEKLEHYAWPGNIRELRNVIDLAVVLAEGDEITVSDLPERIGGPAPPALPSDSGAEPRSMGNLQESLKRYEIKLIVEALNQSNGRLDAAAERLDVPYRTLQEKIKRLGIKRGFGPADPG